MLLTIKGLTLGNLQQKSAMILSQTRIASKGVTEGNVLTDTAKLANILSTKEEVELLQTRLENIVSFFVQSDVFFLFCDPINGSKFSFKPLIVANVSKTKS